MTVHLRALKPGTRLAETASDTSRLWTVEEVCGFLGVSKRWVHERTRLGEIPCYRFGTMLRFDPQEIRRWITQYRSAPEGAGGKSP